MESYNIFKVVGERIRHLRNPETSIAADLAEDGPNEADRPGPPNSLDGPRDGFVSFAPFMNSVENQPRTEAGSDLTLEPVPGIGKFTKLFFPVIILLPWVAVIAVGIKFPLTGDSPRLNLLSIGLWLTGSAILAWLVLVITRKTKAAYIVYFVLQIPGYVLASSPWW